jgi:hypothetical protein
MCLAEGVCGKGTAFLYITYSTVSKKLNIVSLGAFLPLSKLPLLYL